MKLAFFALVSCLAAAAPALVLADLPPLEEVVINGKEYVADPSYMTVYTFDHDAQGVSNCYDGCARAWPPVLTTQAQVAAPLSVITRKDGKHQLAIFGKPLYTYFQDKKQGDATGDGVGGVWHLVPSVD